MLCSIAASSMLCSGADRNLSELLFAGYKEAVCFGVSQLSCKHLLLRLAL